ncbi:MAG: 16S rRNA (cytidine(1402)-2'-O)-methyltransferase [Actinomycetota bacterium]
MAGKDKNRGKGTLFICATPIGNLDDASFRLISTLKKAGMIAAEDTRTTKKLMNRYRIGPKKLISYHDFSKKDKIEEICKYLEEGRDIALVSESGMPAIQDPGYELIRYCIENDLPLTVIPGPNAALSALVLSGLPTDSFLFLGFMPRSRGKRKARLQQVKTVPYTLIFYESPNRVRAFLEDLKEVMGNRKVCMVREITKIYEEAVRGTASEVLSALEERRIKGEVVVVAEGHRGGLIKEFGTEEIRDRLVSLLAEGMSKKQAMKIIRLKYDIDRQTLYNISTKI